MTARVPRRGRARTADGARPRDDSLRGRRALGSRPSPEEIALPRRRITRLTPLDQALDALAAHLGAARPVTLPVADAVGLVLAARIEAPADRPDRPVAAVDGLALDAASVQGATPGSPVRLTARPASVDAGDPMPAGTDTVLPPDTVEAAGGAFEATASAAPGHGVRAVGEDAARGEVLVAAGRRLSPLDVAVARAAGVAEATVRVAPVGLLVVAAGDGTAIGSGPAALRTGERRAVADLLAGWIEALGGVPDEPRVVQGDARSIAAALETHGAALVVTVGGTGEGGSDHAVEAIEAAGTLLARAVAIAPGEATVIGHCGGRGVVMLPGRLDAALGGFLQVVAPVLRRRLGIAPDKPTATAPLAAKVASRLGVADLRFVALRDGAAVPLGGEGLPLGALAAATHVVVVPPGAEGWPAGTTVELQRLPGGPP